MRKIQIDNKQEMNGATLNIVPVCVTASPAEGVSAGLPIKHRRPQAGDVWLEKRLKVQKCAFSV